MWADDKTGNPRAWFVTLTYDDQNLPENGSLDPDHFRSFIRAMRESEGSLSYYGCGEYGDQYSRPHYHAVLFGPEFSDRVPIDGRQGPNVFSSDYLGDTWGRGITEFSSVTLASASYVAGYVRKKVAAMENPDLYTRVDPDTGELVSVTPEFARMSRRPAIGKRWIEKNWQHVYAHDRVVIDGHEMKPPRYYDKWMETDHSGTERPCPDGCDEHRERILEVKYDRWDPDFDDSAYKRQAREAIHTARVGLFQQRDAF